MNATRLVIWSVAAAAAIGVTTTAVTVANATGGGRDDVLSQDDVSRELGEGAAADGSAPGEPSPSSTMDRSVLNGTPITLDRTPGRLVVECDGDEALLTSWSPNPGYRVDEVVRGPAAEVSVWFESDSFDDVEVVVTCDGDKPTANDLVEPDDHGGDRDDDEHDDNSGRG